MHKFKLPAISASYIEQNVYNIRYSVDDNAIFTVVAPDVYVAVQAFAYFRPGSDILNIVCCGPCVALYPTFPSNE